VASRPWPDIAPFEFHDEWQVAAEPAEVWEVVRAVERWPEWWPYARSVRLLSAGSSGTIGTKHRFAFRTRLPYSMGFDSEIVAEQPGASVDTTVSGKVYGTGLWRVAPVEGGTAVIFDWVVTPRPLWMRLAAPLARPIFVWNHRSLMLAGGAALASRLGVRLISASVHARPPRRRSVVG
jgi:hypothetical protein